MSLLGVYAGATWVLEPALPALLAWRRRRGREDPVRLPERRGHAGRPRPEGPLVWAHGASLGEALSLLPLVEGLTARGLAVVLTAGTRTAAEVVGRRLPAGALHQYAPLDGPRAVARFLDHWRPGLALAAESELWPNTILALARRRIPLVLVNGRLSARSAARWARVPGAARALLSRLALVLAQSEADAARFARLGAGRVAVAGNLKLDAAPPAAEPTALARLEAGIGGRPAWIAASTHAGEEAAILAAHRALAARRPDLLTVVVPRHPERGAEVEALAVAAELVARRRSREAEPAPAPDTGIFVADTVGELGLFYRLSRVVFVGGSLVPRGGHNPVEALRLGGAVLHGPHVDNFRGLYADLDAAGAALRVADADALAAGVGGLLDDPARVRAMARAGAAQVEAAGGALARTLAALEPFLAPLHPW